jgi:uncharacterized protein YjiK
MRIAGVARAAERCGAFEVKMMGTDACSSRKDLSPVPFLKKKGDVWFFLVVSFLLPFPSLSQKKQKEISDTPVTVSRLSLYNLSEKKPKQFILPKKIGEASGLAMTDDGRLFAHDDERAVVYQLDYSNGRIVKQFALGRFGVKGDFEGIAIKGKLLYLVRSDGVIYEFPEANDGQTVEFKTYATFLSAKHDVEGLEYDAETDCLLLLCKGSAGKGFSNQKAVYAFSLKAKSLSEKPRFLISLDAVSKRSDNDKFLPSGIALHPKAKTFFIIAAHGSSIIELSREGKVLAQQRINNKANPHPEGIAFAPDLTLILCNDGQDEAGSISLYPLRSR